LQKYDRVIWRKEVAKERLFPLNNAKYLSKFLLVM